MPVNKNNNLIHERWQNVISIWHNKHQDDVGLEKMLRLLLAGTQFIFPGLYLKQYFQNRSQRAREVMTDFFVLIKMVLPLLVIYLEWYNNLWIYCIAIWLMLETLMYVPTLIFASDLFNPPRSYRRSMLLVFINYIEIVLDFAVIYAAGNFMNITFSHWYDPIYFSFSTSASLGMGDFYPVTAIGKMMVSFQSIIFLVYVVLFINVFSNKVEHKGYFDKSKNS